MTLAPYIRALLPIVLLTAAGCSSSSGAETSEPAGDAGPSIGCATDPRVKTFAANLKATSADGKFVIEILNAEPSPPRRGAGDAGMNVWKVKVTRDGQPVTEQPTVTTYMPDHAHGSPKVPVVVPNSDGTFTVNTLFFFMAGVWEIKFSPTAVVEPTTLAMFSLCVQ